MSRKTRRFDPRKEGGPKPILSWGTRAYNLASYTVPRNDGLSHHMVDFVTWHGVNSCKTCTHCASKDNALMIARLQPKLVVVNAASHDTVQTITEEQKKGRLPNTVIRLTNEHDHQFIDELLGGRVSNSSIIRRARERNATHGDASGR